MIYITAYGTYRYSENRYPFFESMQTKVSAISSSRVPSPWGRKHSNTLNRPS